MNKELSLKEHIEKIYSEIELLKREKEVVKEFKPLPQTPQIQSEIPSELKIYKKGEDTIKEVGKIRKVIGKILQVFGLLFLIEVGFMIYLIVTKSNGITW